MSYFVTLSDREFSLTHSARRSDTHFAFRASSGEELEVELLSPPTDRRPALVRVNGAVVRVATEHLAGSGARAGAASARVDGLPVRVRIETELERRARPVRNAAAHVGTPILAPMPGRIVKVNVAVGDVVPAGTALLSIEAMKMENELVAPVAGRVSRLAASAGTTVEADQELALIEPE
jgi:biotin carboxyl carrier protein